ncbi:MAG TPA: replicative DNA helicase [Ktedonobacterales bacterium]
MAPPSARCYTLLECTFYTADLWGGEPERNGGGAERWSGSNRARLGGWGEPGKSACDRSLREDAVEKLLPQNVEAEAAVLGSILIDPEAIIQVADFLRPEDFYRDAHLVIYKAAIELYEEREPADLITLTDELARRGKLEEIGGASYVSSLANTVPTSANVEYYGHIVERTAVLRRLIHAAGQIAAVAYNEPDANTALDQAEKLIFNISQHYTRSDFEHVRDTLHEYIDKLEHLHEHRGSIVGVATGFSDLDKMTGGLQKSDLIILAARPSVGKTALALSLAHNSALRFGHSVALFSLEMSKEQLVARLLSMDAGIDQSKLRTGYLDDDEWERISKSVGQLSEASIYIDDTPGITLAEMRSKARRLMMERGFSLMIVDYLQLMQGSSLSGRGHENRVQEVSEISRGLKSLARELSVPVLALAQLSRAVESRTEKKPQLSDLRESGCITGDSLIYLPDQGVHRPIDQLVGQSEFNVLALNTDTWQLEPRQVLRAFATGRKAVYRLTTRLGRSVRATANHQFLAIDGWHRLDELTPGMRLALPRTLPSPKTSSMRDEELALLGHLIGDGCTLPRHAIQYTTKDRDLADLVAKLAQSTFGDAVVPRVEAQQTWYQVYLSSAAHLTHRVRTPVAAWLHDMGVFGLRSYEKRVPERIFQQPVAGIAVFLRHLWATDGNASLPPRGIPAIYYASSSRQLACDVQMLLLRFGINARVVRVKQPNKGRDQFHVVVSGKPDQELFINCVGIAGERKQQMLEAVRVHLGARVENTNRDVLPGAVWQSLVVPAMRLQKMTGRQMQAALNMSYCGSTLYKHGLGRARAARVAHVVASAPLAHLARSDVYWDEIKSIEPDGEEDVYDLTVDEHHNFVANGVIAHNSIEQDADIVMFIYREDVYNPETERKNIADIIVAKHRNGPIGQVSLYFQAAQTRYRDLELQRVPEF